MDLSIANSAVVIKIIPTPDLLPLSFQNSDRYNTAKHAFGVSRLCAPQQKNYNEQEPNYVSMLRTDALLSPIASQRVVR